MLSPITTVFFELPVLFIVRFTIDLLIMTLGILLAIRLRKKGRLDKARFIAFIVLIVWSALVMFFTVLGRRSKPGAYGFNLDLFSSYHGLAVENSSSMLISTLLNIMMFIPIGITLCVVLNNKHRFVFSFMIVIGFSLLIETGQLILQCGFFELDDLFNNTLGGLIGIIICLTVSLICRMIQKHRKEVSLESKDDS